MCPSASRGQPQTLAGALPNKVPTCHAEPCIGRYAPAKGVEDEDKRGREVAQSNTAHAKGCGIGEDYEQLRRRREEP